MRMHTALGTSLGWPGLARWFVADKRSPVVEDIDHQIAVIGQHLASKDAQRVAIYLPNSIEFAAALLFGGELGQAYLGMQGDIWDAQKDMALALFGTTIMLAALASAGRLPIRRAELKGDAPL